MLMIGKSGAAQLIFANGFETCFPGQTQVWDGGGDNVHWADPGNWVGNVVPANNDSVSIPVVVPQVVVYDQSMGTRVVRCLDSKRALSVTGGNLEILDSGRVDSSVSVTDGAVKVTGRLRVEVQ